MNGGASVCRKSMFLKQTSNSLSLSPCPLSPGKGDFTGTAALTKQGRLKSVAHSRCTMQRHQRLTNRIGATPQTPFSKIILVYRQSKLCLFQAQFLFFAKKLLTIVRNRIIISLSPISDLTICRQGESAWITKTTEKNCMNIIMY